MDQVRDGMGSPESYRALSLDVELTGTDDGFSLADTLGTVEAAYDRIDDREAAKEGLRALPEREREILYLRYFEDMSPGPHRREDRCSPRCTCPG